MSVGASSTIFSPVYPAFFSASGEISRGPVRSLQPRSARHRRARTKIPHAIVPQRRIGSDHRLHVIGLLDRMHHRPPHGRIIERRLQLIEPHRRDVPGRYGDIDLQLSGFPQHRQPVRVRRQPPIDLARLQRAGDRRLVGDDPPLDPVEMRDLRPGRPRRPHCPEARSPRTARRRRASPVPARSRCSDTGRCRPSPSPA